MNLDPRLTQLGVTVQQADRTLEHWRIIAAWITVGGNWDGVPEFARQYQLDTLGGDHHAFGRAFDMNGYIAPYAGFVLSWPDGADQRTPEADGWANLPLQAGYDWSVTSGPYTWGKFGNADKLVGIGLPFPPLPWEPGSVLPLGHDHIMVLLPDGEVVGRAVNILGGMHVSFFCVWQQSDAEQPEPPAPPTGWRCRLARWLVRLAERLCPTEISEADLFSWEDYWLAKTAPRLLAEARKQEPSEDWEKELYRLCPEMAG